MIHLKKLAKSEHRSPAPESLGAVEKTLISAVQLFPGTKPALKIRFYQEFLHFLEIIALYLIERNNLILSLRSGITADLNDRLTSSFLQLLFNYKITQKEGDSYLFTQHYRHLKESDFKRIRYLVEGNLIRLDEIPALLHLKISGYQLVNQLITHYRHPAHELKDVKFGDKWEELIDHKYLDYEIRLAETLKQLTQLRFPNKITSPFDDSYYTESGRNAFNNFTRERFLSCIRHIRKHYHVRQVLDVGCGYGNYIEAIAEEFPDTTIWGIELQEKVLKEARKRFAGNQSIFLFNKNIFEFKTDVKFDLMLFNYVLFYFSNEQKEQLFKQLNNQLDDEGSILICQYYAGIELLKTQLAKKQNNNSSEKKIGRYYGNKILYANALWNESSDAFVQSEIWNEFIVTLEKTGFEVTELTNADPFYYSLFVEVRKTR